MPNLQAYQNQQDAFVQQFLQNQAQYNQGVMGGQQPQRVDLGTTWNQASESIKDGRYQGNPFATGNVDALMGMFGQYGITPPQGFQDQLISQLGQQSAPPMYGTGSLGPQFPNFPQARVPLVAPAQQPAFDVPRPINPGTGLPYGQPLTDLPIGPNGEYWPAFRSPQQPTPPAASAPPPAPPPPERAPWAPPPPPPGGWRSEQQRRDAEYQSRVQYMMNPGLNQDASPVRPPVVAEPEPTPRPPVREQQPESRRWGRFGQFINMPPGVGRFMDFVDSDGDGVDDGYQPGPGLPPPGAAQPIPPSQQLPPSRNWQSDFDFAPPGTAATQAVVQYINPQTGEKISFANGGQQPRPGSGWVRATRRDFDQFDGVDLNTPGAARPIPMGMVREDPSRRLPPGRMPDWGFPVDTKLGGPAMDTPPAAQPNPSAPWSSNDPWSYPLLPGMRRGPSGEQIMTEEARQAEIKRREQETGRRYVQPRAPGQTGSWLPAPKPASQKKDQSAAMAEYIRTQATPGRARPTPTRTQGTRRR
jgi:hypothetical protein